MSTLEWGRQDAATDISPASDAWPMSLQAMGARMPSRLWVRGDLTVVGRPMIAVLGAREPSVSEKRATIDLVTTLSALGWVIAATDQDGVPNLALRAASRIGGQTVLVSSTGDLSRAVDAHSLQLGEYPIVRSGMPRRLRRAQGHAIALASKALAIGWPECSQLVHSAGPIGVLEGSVRSMSPAPDWRRVRAVECVADVNRLR